MNGNFEQDNGAYPYTATRFGERVFVVHTPTQEKVLDVALPVAVATEAALSLNSLFHGPRVRKTFDTTLSDDRKSIRSSALSAAASLYHEGGLGGHVYSQLKDLLK